MCECTDPSNIPDWCEVDVLIDIMETHVLVAHELLPQWTRAAFHDAGTFDKSANVGGANGCLLNHFPMRLEPENAFLRLPLNTLMDVTAHLIYSTSTFSVIMSLGIRPRVFVRASDYYKQFTVNIVTLFIFDQFFFHCAAPNITTVPITTLKKNDA